MPAGAFRRWPLIGGILVAARTPGPGGTSVSRNPELVAQIDRVSQAFLLSEGDEGEDAALAAAREIFVEHGVPSTAVVGDDMTYRFIMLNMLGQPSRSGRCF